jgi:hypothetical protein
MKKKIMGLILAAAAACSLCLPAFAAGKVYNAAAVTFNGTDLIMKTDETNAFANILPGDDRTEQITLSNQGSGTVIYYMDASVLSALEASDAVQVNKITAYTYDMSVQAYTKAGAANGSPTVIYSTTAGGINSAGMNILNEDLNGTETVTTTTNGTTTKSNNWVAVAQLDPGESAKITFSMRLDGAATQNEYNNLAGQLAFQFRVRDLTRGTEYKTVTKTVYDVRNIIKTVKTGDYTPIVVLVTILVLGFGLMYLLFRKKNDKGKHAAQHVES